MPDNTIQKCEIVQILDHLRERSAQLNGIYDKLFSMTNNLKLKQIDCEDKNGNIVETSPFTLIDSMWCEIRSIEKLSNKIVVTLSHLQDIVGS